MSDEQRRPLTPRERVLEVLLDLRGVVPFDVSLTTVRPPGRRRDVPLHVYRMAPAHVQHGLEYFIPRSPDFRTVLENPREIIDWSRAPRFRETATAREHLLAAGFTQGVSLALQSDGRTIGTFHFNVSYTEEFTDEELQAIDRAHSGLENAVRGTREGVAARLTPRELEVLALIGAGASNPVIADALHITRRTAATHVEHILQKLHVVNRLQAVVAASELGLI